MHDVLGLGLRRRLVIAMAQAGRQEERASQRPWGMEVCRGMCVVGPDQELCDEGLVAVHHAAQLGVLQVRLQDHQQQHHRHTTLSALSTPPSVPLCPTSQPSSLLLPAPSSLPVEL